MVGPRTQAAATLACNRPDGAADETGALAPRRDRDWAKPTLESGTRDTYVTRRWLIGHLGPGRWARQAGCQRVL
jgi:hypothetical protein